MAIQSFQYEVAKVGISHEVIFAGDNVRLAGQIDYPNRPAPPAGYPLLFILPHACSTGRQSFQYHTDIGVQAGYAVFRWDKRGTGRSGSGGMGCGEQDATNAYLTAVQQADIDRNNVVIWSQMDASLLLGENYDCFKDIQKPLGIILSGNMLDENAILTLDTRLFCVTGERDWNLASRYAINTINKHNETHKLDSASYIARFANRELVDTRNKMFHAGAESTIQDWLISLCPTSTLI